MSVSRLMSAIYKCSLPYKTKDHTNNRSVCIYNNMLAWYIIPAQAALTVYKYKIVCNTAIYYQLHTCIYMN